MRIHSEVNFEKRGKLEDHQTCPVCKVCLCWCEHGKPSKKLFTAVLFALLLFLPTLSLAADAPYNFETLDISVPGHPGLIAFPEDIGDSGKILSSIRENDTTETVVFGKVNRRGIRRQLARFGCSDVPFFDTIGESINRRGDVVGSCIISNNKQVGFIRFRSGFLALLDFPGADGTQARGLSNDGKITGQFFGPLDQPRGALAYRFHCFTYDQATNQFIQLDFLLPSTFVDCSAINKQGQILVRFNIVTDQNDTIQQGFALRNPNGSWEFPFPLSFGHIGGLEFFVADMNNDGQAIIERSNGDEDWNGLALFDDGALFDIPTPEGWLNIQVGGMNNKGEFVGNYFIRLATGQIQRHGFLAIPR